VFTPFAAGKSCAHPSVRLPQALGATVILVTSILTGAFAVNLGFGCVVYEPTSSELNDIASHLFKDPSGKPILLSACLLGIPREAPSRHSERVPLQIQYEFAWEPHKSTGGISFRWAQDCKKDETDEAECNEPVLQASVFEGPWFEMLEGFREDDVVSVIQLVRGLLNEGEFILGFEVPSLQAGVRWSVREHGYFVTIGYPGWACQDVYPVKYDCASLDHCAWIIDLESRRKCV
jgi:hypothetical protein